MVTKRTLICLTRMDSTTTSPANVVIMAWSSRPERMRSWLSTATMMPMAAILKIRSMSIHIPPIFHQRQRMAAASPAANPSL